MIPDDAHLILRLAKDARDLRADTVLLSNQVPLDRALGELIFMVAVPATASP